MPLRVVIAEDEAIIRMDLRETLELSMSKTDAFGFIQRTAMSERTRMRDVADRILDGSLRPGPG